MGMFDNIFFENGYTTDEPLPDEMLVNDWGQTNQLFCSLDFYCFRKRNGEYILCRMFPPVTRTDMEAGNKGNVSKFIDSIDRVDSIEDYAEWWIPVNNADGYLRIGQRHEGYDYEYFVIIENNTLSELVPYRKTKIDEIYTDKEPKDNGGYLMNEDKVEKILNEKEPIV